MMAGEFNAMEFEAKRAAAVSISRWWKSINSRATFTRMKWAVLNAVCRRRASFGEGGRGEEGVLASTVRCTHGALFCRAGHW